MERILEPELMDDAAQALAYARADFADVNRGFVDRFRTMFPDLAGSRVVDLGCGPADIPIRLARTLPRLGRPRAGVLVMDLCRPDSPSHARDLAETYAGGESPLLKRDFYNSLRAAFTPAEVARQLARQLPQLSCRVVSDRHWVVTGRLP